MQHETQLALAEAERQTLILQGAQEEASKQTATAQEAASQAQKQHAEQVSVQQIGNVHTGEVQGQPGLAACACLEVHMHVERLLCLLEPRSSTAKQSLG